MVDMPDGAEKRRIALTVLRRALLVGAAWSVLGVSFAEAQSIGLRGRVEEEETAAALYRPSLTDRSTTLTPKGDDARKMEDALPEPRPAINPEEEPDPDATGSLFQTKDPDDPFAGAAPATASLPGPAIAPKSAKAEPDAQSAADAEGEVDPAKAVSRIEPVSDSGANEPAATDNARTEAIDDRNLTADTDPYTAAGMRVGSFILRPLLEQGLSWTSNASGGGGQTLYSETTLRLGFASDWSAHAATIDAWGTWLEPLSGTAPQEPKAGIDGTLRLDLAGPWSADGELSWSLAREDADSATPLPAGTSRPLENSVSGSATLAKDEGKARLSLKGAIDRLSYGDSAISGGGALSQKERNQTLLSTTLRAGYEISPALVPFVEIGAGRRIYDLKTDTAGYARSATQLALRAGLALDRGEKLNGELAVGWLREDFDDTRLASVSGLSAEGQLNWSPARETTLTLRGSTSVEGTTTAGKSGSLLYAAEAGVTRRVRADVEVNAALQASLRDYAGSSDRDTILAASAGFTWWLNRHFGVTGRARHEMVLSTLAGQASETTTLFLGVKLQR